MTEDIGKLVQNGTFGKLTEPVALYPKAKQKAPLCFKKTKAALILPYDGAYHEINLANHSKDETNQEWVGSKDMPASEDADKICKPHNSKKNYAHSDCGDEKAQNSCKKILASIPDFSNHCTDNPYQCSD